MPHSIYTGSFHALELRWMDTISELQRKDPLAEVNVLVGSNVLASYLKRRLAESGRTAANIRFHNFLDVALRLASISGSADTKPRLPRLGATFVLEDLLAGNIPSVFGSVCGYRGFRDALLETFRDLRDAGIDPGELDSGIRKNKNPDRRAHLAGFAELYRRYRDRVTLFHDVDDDFRAAIRNCAEARKSQVFRQLLVYGIYDVTGQQDRLLASLKDCISLVYFIPFVNSAVSEFALPFLESRKRELGVEPVQLRPGTPGNSLESLAAAGFGLTGSPFPVPRSQSESVLTGNGEPGTENVLKADGSLTLVSAPGESRTAVEIVREIFRAVRDGTIRGFHEAAVILRQPESDLPILLEMFRLREVPHFVHGGGKFSERPLGRAILALSRLEPGSYSRDAVLGVMELAVAALPEDLTSRWDVQGWRTLTNDPRFLAGLDSWDSGTQALIEKAQADVERAEARPTEAEDPGSGIRPERIARRRLAAATILREAWQMVKAAADWPAALSWQDWAALLEQHIEPLLGKSEDWPLFSSVLDELAMLGLLDSPGYRVPVEKIRSALSEAISSRSFPVGRFQRSGVNILSTSAARGLRFPLVILPGLDEGRFPARLRQDPLLLDPERSLLENLPIRSRRIDEEKLLFDMAARSAEKRLVLMTSRLDENSDRERIPSQFFLRAASAVTGRAVAIRDLAEGVIPGFHSVSLDSPAPGPGDLPVDEGEIRLRIVTADRESTIDALNVLARLEPLRFSRPLQYDQARWLKKLTAYDGLIADRSLASWTLEKLGPSAGQVSASRIEEYVKCPYAFFLNRVMDLQAWDEESKVEAMDPLERGLAIHAILEQFLKGSGEDIFQCSGEKPGQLLGALARESLEAARPLGIADLLWEIERDALLNMLTGWLEFEKSRDDGGMRVSRLEQVFGEFGPDEKFPPFRLTAGRHVFNFRGRIDRVDFSTDRKHARVVDYKTGMLPESMARESSRTPLMAGEKIQVAVYAGALSVLEGFEGVETVEGEYLHLQPKNGLTIPCTFQHEKLQDALQTLKGILEVAGDGIEGGLFFARTSGKVRPSGHCDYCDYLPICGKDRIQREERKANDPAVQKFLQIVGAA
jgi:RecB family exonuclease